MKFGLLYEHQLPRPWGEDGEHRLFQEALCSARSQGKRAALGADLLGKLLREKQLYAATKNDFRTLSRFRPDLFLRIWSSLAHIGTQDGKMIRLR